MATKNCKNGCDLKGSRSHAKGGIKGVVEGSQKQIEVESNEVIIRASVLNDPKRYIYTGTHRQIVEQINGGFNSVVNDSDDCILVEAGQVVINKKTLDDDKIRTYTGTNKEVLNKINKHLNSGVSIYKNGGIIPIGNNKIKTIFFKKDKFTKPQAIAWAKNHGFDYAQSYDENKSNYIFRCNDKNAFKKHTYRTIELKESGIKIIIGVEKMEQGGREAKMSNFVRAFYSDIQSKYPIKIDNTHDKFEMFGVKGRFELLIPSDKMEGEILMYFEMLTNRSMADFLNIKGDVIVTPVIKCYIDKDYNITFDYSELDKYLGQYGVEEFKEGGEVIRKTKNTPFSQLCNVFKSEMERDYGFKFTENSDNFNSRYGNGHVEFTMKKDDKNATAFIYFEGKRGFPIIFGFDEKGDYSADYSTFETVLKLIKREEFAEGGEVKKKVARRNLPLNTTYKIIDSFYTGGLFENPHICENCGKPIANVGVVENEKGEDFEVGMDCAKTLSGIDDDLKFTDAEDDFKKANQIRQKINKAKKNESLNLKVEITSFKGNVVIEAINKKNNRYEFQIASEPQDFIEKYMPDVLKMVSNKEKIGYKPIYTKIKGFDFSKVQRKGNEFEYSFDNVKFKIYDLEKKSNSGMVNSHIAYNVYINGKLIGKDTTYNNRGVEGDILGIINKYYFEKYDNLYRKTTKTDTEILQGGLSDNKTILDISKKHNVSLDFANEQFEKGISVEMEHTDSRDIASEIALDNLSESINYYVELEKMEEKLNNIKLSSNYTDSQLIELCKKADINKETLVFDVPDDKVEYYKSLGFVVKN